jgi:creatinine amidohydrolase
MSQDLNPAGAVGEAAKARPEKGHESADFGAQAFVALLREIDAFELGA